MSMITAGFAFAKDFIESGATEKLNKDALLAKLTEAAGAQAAVSTYVDGNGVEYPNYFMILFDNINFADYLN